jgi:uncharacterized membrane protein
MSTLVAISFDDASKATQMVDSLKKLQEEGLLKLEDTVTVVRDAEGKVTYHTNHPTPGAGSGALMGGLWGLLIGSIFLMPVFGVALGAATGAAAGALDKVAVDETFKNSINDQLRPNSSAIIIRVSGTKEPEQVLERVKGFGGTVLHTNLSAEDEAKLQAALKG